MAKHVIVKLFEWYLQKLLVKMIQSLCLIARKFLPTRKPFAGFDAYKGNAEPI